MKPSLLTITAPVVVLALTTFARADEITFKIISLPDIPLSGSVYMKTRDKPWYKLIDVSTTGTKTDEIKCSLGIYFKAIVTIWYVPTEDEKDCHPGEIAFKFREKTYSAALRQAANGELLTRANAPVKVFDWQKDLTSALEAGNSEIVLKRSNDIHDFLAASGSKNEAKPYEILPLDLAKTKLSGPGELFYDPSQQKYVLSDTDISNLKTLQESAKIKADGKLNWDTMHALGSYDANAVASEYRTGPISPSWSPM